MANGVDAVVAALRVVLRDAEMHPSQFWWKSEVVNRSIGQLPGVRTALIGHVSAALAYLETHQELIGTEMVVVAARKSGAASRGEYEGARRAGVSVRGRGVASGCAIEPSGHKAKWLN